MLQKFNNIQSLPNRLNGKILLRQQLLNIISTLIYYNNDNQFFKDNRKINSTELSKAVCKLKQLGQSPEIRLKIVNHATPYQCGSKTYNLC